MVCNLRPLAIPAALATALSAPVLAQAAEVTDLPPQWRGDVHLVYGGGFEETGLEEDGALYGVRHTTVHTLTGRAEVALYEGVIFRLDLPGTAAQRIAYPEARQMLYEPTTGSGSFENGPTLETDGVRSGGFQGLWVGVALAPFREDYDRGFAIDTRFDFALRTPAPKGTLYGPNRGANPGGVGLRASGAFSKRTGMVAPYLRLGLGAVLRRRRTGRDS